MQHGFADWIRRLIWEDTSGQARDDFFNLSSSLDWDHIASQTLDAARGPYKYAQAGEHFGRSEDYLLENPQALQYS